MKLSFSSALLLGVATSIIVMQVMQEVDGKGAGKILGWPYKFYVCQEKCENPKLLSSIAFFS